MARSPYTFGGPGPSPTPTPGPSQNQQPPAAGNPYAFPAAGKGRGGGAFNYSRGLANLPGLYGKTSKTPPAPPSPTGTESGPGILEDWFNQRASGTDPAYEYAMKRGGDAIDTRMAAGGSFNSGARAQQQSDFAANMGAQRLGQLDALAGGASGEHQNRVNSMFNQGLNLAGGQSGINSAYDLAAGRSMSDALSALLGYTTNKAGVDSKSNQQGLANITSILGLI